MTLEEIESELKKRTKYKYKWGRKQNNEFDKLTEFIYSTKSFDDVIEEVKRRFANREDIKEIGDYAVNRWYNFWSAEALESIFKNHPRVIKAENSRDKYCDFFIDNVPFDLKTTVFPKSVAYNLQHAKLYPKKLALWFYANQSSEQRQHFHNRLFIVLHSTKRPGWTLKSEITWLAQLINNYLDNFDASKLMELQLNEHQFKSDIIWGIES